MKRHQRFLRNSHPRFGVTVLALVFGCLGVAAGAGGPRAVTPRKGIKGCTVTRPTGDYALVSLAFVVDEDLNPEDDTTQWQWRHVAAMRNGVIVIDDGVTLRRPGGTLTLADGKLTGRFQRVSPHPRDVKVDAVVRDGVISGSAVFGKAAATVSGTVVPESELARDNTFPDGIDWPRAQGPIMNGLSATPTGVALIDNVREIRMIWRCEEWDVGRGMGNVTRMMGTWGCASGIRALSGCAAPVFGRDRVFFKYYVPAEPPANGQKDELDSLLSEDTAGEGDGPGMTVNSELQRVADNLVPDGLDLSTLSPEQRYEIARKTLLVEALQVDSTRTRLPLRALEKIVPNADDVVLCMDARSGKTLWKAVMPGRGRNVQHHKNGPKDMAPACADGRVFALGMSGWIYAFDAETGEPLWEIEADYDISNQLLVIGDVLVGPARPVPVVPGETWGPWDRGYAGYDVETGRMLWRAGMLRSFSTLTPWVHDGTDYLIGRMGPESELYLGCINARTGEEVWRRDVDMLGGPGGGRGTGTGSLSIYQDIMLTQEISSPDDPDAPAGEAYLCAYRLTPVGPTLMWRREAGNGYSGLVGSETVPLVVKGKFIFANDLSILDLMTGETLSKAHGLPPQNGGYLQAMENFVMSRIDGTHGAIQCNFYKVNDDGTSVLLNPDVLWEPPIGGSTTSYHHPHFYPMVDGRVFLRQENGIYCWDFRSRLSQTDRLLRLFPESKRPRIAKALAGDVAGIQKDLVALFEAAVADGDAFAMQVSYDFIDQIGDPAIQAIAPTAIEAMKHDDAEVSGVACRIMFPDGVPRTDQAEAFLAQMIRELHVAAIPMFDRLQPSAQRKLCSYFLRDLASDDPTAMTQAAKLLVRVDPDAYVPVVMDRAVPLITPEMDALGWTGMRLAGLYGGLVKDEARRATIIATLRKTLVNHHGEAIPDLAAVLVGIDPASCKFVMEHLQKLMTDAGTREASSAVSIIRYVADMGVLGSQTDAHAPLQDAIRAAFKRKDERVVVAAISFTGMLGNITIPLVPDMEALYSTTDSLAIRKALQSIAWRLPKKPTLTFEVKMQDGLNGGGGDIDLDLF